MLANQCGPQQRQHPLGLAQIATVHKDADLRCASQSELLLPQDSLAQASLLRWSFAGIHQVLPASELWPCAHSACLLVCMPFF
jgi:hypothetical protein